MTYGPVDFVALEFKGNQFKGEILPALMDLMNREIVRVIDMIVVKKDADGTVTHQEMQEHDGAVLAVMTDRETRHLSSIPRLPLGDVDALVPLVLRALGLGGEK